MGRERNHLPAGLPAYEGFALLLAFLAPGLGLFLFGAVRLWSIGSLMVLVYLALLLYGLRPLVFRGFFPVRLPPGGWPALAFLAYALVRIPASVVPYEAGLQFLMILSAAAAYLVWTGMAGVGRRWRWMLGAMILLVAASAAYAWIQHTQDLPYKVFHRESTYGARVSGTYFCPNHLASEMSIVMVMAFALMVAPEIPVLLRILAGYGIVMMAGPLLWTQSRSGVLGCVCGLSAAGLLMAVRRGRTRVLWVVLAIPLLVGAAGFAVWNLSPAWRNRVERVLEGDDTRMPLWRPALDTIADRPLLGHGGMSYREIEWQYLTIDPGQRAKYVHNEYLHHLIEFGVVGTLLAAACVLSMLWGFGRRVVTARRDRDAFLCAGAVGAGVAALVHAFFDFNLHIYSISMTLMLIAGVVASILHTSGEWKPWTPGRAGARAFTAAVILTALAGLFFSGRALASHLLTWPAERALIEEQFDRAERLFRLAHRIDPAAWRPPLGLGQIRKTQAEYKEPDSTRRARLADEALDWYVKAQKRHAYSEDVLHGLSHVHALRGDNEACLATLRRLVEIMPRRAFYRTRLGTQLVRMGRKEEAIAQFKRALELDRKDVTARLNLRLLVPPPAPAPRKPPAPVKPAPAVPSSTPPPTPTP